MPQMSTHLHFAKLLAENTDDDVHLCSLLLGIASPDTFSDDDSYYDYHFLEDNEDGDDDIDVRQFYEEFDLKSMDRKEKWFIIGYYAHLWLDEYFKFNSSKLTLYNKYDLPDNELSRAVKELIEFFDYEITKGYYDDMMKELDNIKIKLNFKNLTHVDISKSKQLLKEIYFGPKPKEVHSELLDQKEYLKLMSKSVKRFYKSM